MSNEHPLRSRLAVATTSALMAIASSLHLGSAALASSDFDLGSLRTQNRFRPSLGYCRLFVGPR